MNVFLQIFNNRFLAFLVPVRQPLMPKNSSASRRAHHSNSRPEQAFLFQNSQLNKTQAHRGIFRESYTTQRSTISAHSGNARNISGH
jgi:hypothetical protein